MKALIPVKSDNNLLTTKVVSGGIEKFLLSMSRNFENIKLCEIPKKILKDNLAGNFIERFVIKENPDILIMNEISFFYASLEKYNIPEIFIVHEGLSRGIIAIKMEKALRKAIEHNAHIYFVSKNQFQYWNKTMKRIHNFHLTENHIKGFINPDFCNNLPFVEERTNNTITVGRQHLEKDPFLLHRKSSEINYESLVLTNHVSYELESNQSYVEKNMHWKGKQHTLFSLSHKEVIENISKSKVYVSTCAIESWGITALEALGCGVPLILFTDKFDNHSSEEIVADNSHYIKLNKNCSSAEFKEAVDELSNYSTDKRREIHLMTHDKHSITNWKNDIQRMFDLRLSEIEKSNDLMEFLQ